jgi:hypothetical protein
MEQDGSDKLRRAISINKTGAAKAQLNTAIWLWFRRGDIVAIHMLAVAAHDCFNAIGKIASKPSVYGEWATRQSKSVQKRLREAQNFCKHGLKDLRPYFLEGLKNLSELSGLEGTDFFNLLLPHFESDRAKRTTSHK